MSGPTYTPPDPVGLLTSTTGAVQTASGSDVTISGLTGFGNGEAHRIYCCTTGNLAIKRVNDTSFVVYPVFAGQYVDGHIIVVGGTGSGTGTGMQWIAEV